MISHKSKIKKLNAKMCEIMKWPREKSLEILIDIAMSSTDNMEKIMAIREINILLGYNAPQKIDLISSDGSMSSLAKSREGAVLAEIKRGYS